MVGGPNLGQVTEAGMLTGEDGRWGDKSLEEKGRKTIKAGSKNDRPGPIFAYRVFQWPRSECEEHPRQMHDT